MPLTDLQWQKIAAVENLDGFWRSDVNNAIDSLIDLARGPSAPSRKPLQAITGMQKRTDKLRGQIEDFVHENLLLLEIAEDQGKELREAVGALSELSKTLQRTYREQISFRQKYPIKLTIAFMFNELLTIRSNALGKPLPTSTRNSASSGRFRDYLLACLDATPLKLSKEDFDEALRAAVELPVS